MEISEIIKENRKLKNLSQEELAKELHISRQSILKWETGKSLPTTDQLILLSEIFDCSLDTLLKGDKKMEEKVKHEIDDKRTLKLIYKVGWGFIVPLLFILKFFLHLF
ncbi:helix-turn-helix domain-containing protein [Lactococcus cremoris]|uniref:helix-turn-helix domain-containing protein n=1 Tax=Lactococcus lactis subsp. cremoris TaxID=1359 RepID=UPI0024A68A00|nr:helix-turn-helix transcriptional regulator [Lactococcus cremoris]